MDAEGADRTGFGIFVGNIFWRLGLGVWDLRATARHQANLKANSTSCHRPMSAMESPVPMLMACSPPSGIFLPSQAANPLSNSHHAAEPRKMPVTSQVI